MTIPTSIEIHHVKHYAAPRWLCEEIPNLLGEIHERWEEEKKEFGLQPPASKDLRVLVYAVIALADAIDFGPENVAQLKSALKLLDFDRSFKDYFFETMDGFLIALSMVKKGERNTYEIYYGGD